MADMQIGRLAVALLIPLWGAMAQAPLPELRIEPTDGGSILYVKNVAAQPLTGVLIELLNYPGSYYAFWQDDVTAAPIAPGAEQKTRIGNMTVGAVPDYVKVQAALYADGSTSGVPEKVTLLTGRRKAEAATLGELQQRLEKAQTEGKEKAAVIAELKKWSDSLEPAGKPKRYSQEDVDHAAARSLIGEAAASLNEHSVDEVLTELRAKKARLG